MSWYIANKRPGWRRVETETPLTYCNPDTGEIREHQDGFDGLVRDRDRAWDLLGDVAEALGSAVLRRWEDGDECLDLAAEVRRLRERLAVAEGTVAGYRRTLAGQTTTTRHFPPPDGEGGANAAPPEPGADVPSH